ncbi:MAG: AAA family ATPase [Deltaproteobacteria bacterium]|nr:AAA family ATPase [Deltaproteobacteria bacterium]
MSQPPAPPPLGSPVTDIFVGRKHELGQLQTVLTQVLASRGQLLLLAGEPGVGKTRLAEQFATVARQQHLTALWGRCWEGDGAPAFWPWVQIVRSYVRLCPPDVLAADMGSGAGDIAHVVAEVRERLPHLIPTPARESESARFRFFDSFTTWLKKAATRQPLLLILDDLHWADVSSLRLLQFFARELHDARVLVLGTYRETDIDHAHPLSDALGVLARESQHVNLPGLTREEVAQFIAAVLGTSPPTELVTSVHERTEGNPFFVSELVHVLTSEGRLHGSVATMFQDIGLPQSVRATIRRRLTRVSHDCRRLLARAAVIGREFTVDVLQEVSALSEPSHPLLPFPLLDEALATRLIEHTGDNVTRYRFLHALVRETLYGDIASTERAHLHRLVGEAVERRYHTYLRPYLAELADHFLKAAQEGTIEKAVRYLTQAGERADALLAYEEAAVHYERALTVLPLQETTEEQRCDLLLALGDTCAKAGDTLRAREAFQQAAAIARKRKAAERLAQAALGYGGRGGWGEGGIMDDALVRVLEEALAELPHHESPLRARLLARLSTSLYWSLAPHAAERREALNNHALTSARRLQDPATLAYILMTRHVAVWSADNVEERLAIATEMIELAGKVGNRELALWGHVWRYADLLELGDASAVAREGLALERMAAELRQPLCQWYTTVLRAGRLLMAGHFTEGERLAIHALSIGQEVARGDAFQMFGGQMYMLRREQGRLHELVGVIEQNVALYPALGVYQAVLANCYGELARFEDARGLLVALAADNFSALKKDAHWHLCCSALAATCAILNETTIAAQLYQQFLPYAEHHVVAHPGIISLGSGQHFLGLLASTMQRHDLAVHHFADALASNTRMGLRPVVARTQYEYARLLLSRRRPGDVARARDLLARARATATALEMTSIAARVEELHARLPASRPAQPLAIPSLAEQQPGRSRFHHDGDYWTLEYDDTTVRLKDAKGLHYLAYLVLAPDREVHVVDLLAITDPRPAPSVTDSSRQLIGEQPAIAHTHLREGMNDRPRPDSHARAAYKQRLGDLQDEREEAERFNDSGRAAHVQAEIVFIQRELAAAYGLSAHARSSTNAVEKVRKAVTNRIRASLTQIQKAHPALWRHLFTTVKTGTFCSYHPAPPVEWQS